MNKESFDAKKRVHDLKNADKVAKERRLRFAELELKEYQAKAFYPKYKMTQPEREELGLLRRILKK
jgi:hypothetical protein